jgi:ABC-type lipoprotein release transport system permease subunit
VRGDAAAADAVCAGLHLIQHATSLGAVESTIERRAAVALVLIVAAILATTIPAFRAAHMDPSRAFRDE